MKNNIKIKLVVLLSLLLMNFVPMNTSCAVAADFIAPVTTVLKTAKLYPPRTWNSSLPLSDQSNKSHWVLNPVFSDEFRSPTLNTQKWFN